MRKYLLLLLVLALSFTTAFAADENTIIIKTSKPVGTTVSLDAYTASKDEAFTVDWGDGEEKTYNVDPNGWGYSRRIKTEIKGGTITIKGKLVNFDLTEAGITSVDLHGQTAMKEINLEKNEIATFKQDGADETQPQGQHTDDILRYGHDIADETQPAGQPTRQL